MIDDSLISKRFTAKDIKEIIFIDRNTLFYWINTHRLLKAEIQKPKGTGSQALYSFKNLLELETIRAMAEMGYTLDSIKSIKSQLDRAISIHGNKLSVFQHIVESKYHTHSIIEFIHTREGTLSILKLPRDYNRAQKKYVFDEIQITKGLAYQEAIIGYKYFTLVFDIGELLAALELVAMDYFMHKTSRFHLKRARRRRKYEGMKNVKKKQTVETR